jgi:hypothetical protein
MLAPSVFIQTYCEHPALAYGALLAFKTLRVGFPTARVTVVDNGSHPEVLPRIREACKSVGATLVEQPRKGFIDFYRHILIEQDETDSVVICDPDVMFWDDMESLSFDAVIAGRKIPDLKNYGVTSVSRLHPSLIFVPSVSRLREEMRKGHINKINHLGQFSTHLRGEKLFFDTLAPLYQMMPEKCHAFTPEELDKFDHLFYGSHLPVIQPGLSDAGMTATAHMLAATGDYKALKGLWRAQETAFEAQNSAALPQNALATMLETCDALAKAQGVNYGHTEAVYGLIRGITHDN